MATFSSNLFDLKLKTLIQIIIFFQILLRFNWINILQTMPTRVYFIIKANLKTT